MGCIHNTYTNIVTKLNQRQVTFHCSTTVTSMGGMNFHTCACCSSQLEENMTDWPTLSASAGQERVSNDDGCSDCFCGLLVHSMLALKRPGVKNITEQVCSFCSCFSSSGIAILRGLMLSKYLTASFQYFSSALTYLVLKWPRVSPNYNFPFRSGNPDRT